jgi:hypothetical protein
MFRRPIEFRPERRAPGETHNVLATSRGAIDSIEQVLLDGKH